MRLIRLYRINRSMWTKWPIYQDLTLSGCYNSWLNPFKGGRWLSPGININRKIHNAHSTHLAQPACPNGSHNYRTFFMASTCSPLKTHMGSIHRVPSNAQGNSFSVSSYFTCGGEEHWPGKRLTVHVWAKFLPVKHRPSGNKIIHYIWWNRVWMDPKFMDSLWQHRPLQWTKIILVYYSSLCQSIYNCMYN